MNGKQQVIRNVDASAIKALSARCAAAGLSSSSPERRPSSRFLTILALPFAVSLVLAFSPCAWAATWPVSASGLSASVAFNQTYSAGGSSYAHSGIDIIASAGTQISTPLAGVVSFTGAVPSGDSRIGAASEGTATMLAVSIALEDGRTITLMPFETISVERGQQVAEGAGLGTLAAYGDISSSQTHLHMGLKRGSVYYDPMSLFGAASGGSQNQGAASAAQDAAALQAFTAASAAALEQVALQTDANEQMGQSVVSEAIEAAAAVEETGVAVENAPVQLGTISSGELARNVETSDGVSVGMRVGELVAPLAQACLDQMQALGGFITAMSQKAGIPATALEFACAALGVAACAGLLFLCVRFLLPLLRVGLASLLHLIRRTRQQRKNEYLFQGEGDDSMHKLFPASGVAFISRSR